MIILIKLIVNDGFYIVKFKELNPTKLFKTRKKNKR